MRGGADGVGASRPQLVPSTILRKNFEFIAAIKPHEVPNRPQFYMIGSGITEASLNAVTIGATCTHEDWRAPCFTTAEIALAKTQLSEEQTAFDALTAAERAAHTADGGLAVCSSLSCRALTPVTDMSTFNERFIAGGGVLERVCTVCSASSHQSIFYKRIGGNVATAGLDWNDLLRSNWYSNNNNLGTNFELYSTKADLLAGENKWAFCNYDDGGIGFPRDCGPHGHVGGQWNSLNRGGQIVTWNMPEPQ